MSIGARPQRSARFDRQAEKYRTAVGRTEGNTNIFGFPKYRASVSLQI
jgi:hypothetical protein